jgi:hypothetical protein
MESNLQLILCHVMVLQRNMVMRQNVKYILVIIGLGFLVMMLMDFTGRVAEAGRLKYKRDQIAVEGTQLGMTQVYLQTRVAYVSSEGAVLEYAYSKEHLVQPGDVRVVPVPVANQTALPTPTPYIPRPYYSNWDYWWALFTGPES